MFHVKHSGVPIRCDRFKARQSLVQSVFMR